MFCANSCNAYIAHGYKGVAVELQDGTLVHGIAFNDADPLVVRLPHTGQIPDLHSV